MDARYTYCKVRADGDIGWDYIRFDLPNMKLESIRGYLRITRGFEGEIEILTGEEL